MTSTVAWAMLMLDGMLVTVLLSNRLAGTRARRRRTMTRVRRVAAVVPAVLVLVPILVLVLVDVMAVTKAGWRLVQARLL